MRNNKYPPRTTGTGYRGTSRTLNQPSNKHVNCANRSLVHRYVWNGVTRPGWQHPRSDGTNGGSSIIIGVAMCVGAYGGGCPMAALAVDRDHRVRYRKYISDNADLETYCDGQCHFLGISQADAMFYSNDTANLDPLCGTCHNIKTTREGNPLGGGAPTPVGPCPGANCNATQLP